MNLFPFGHPRRWLAAWSEGELPEARRRRVEAHLAHCASCRARLAEVGRGLEAARTLGPVPLPAERRQLIERALGAALANPSPRSPLPSMGTGLRWAAVGALAIAVGFGLLLWTRGRRGVEVETATATPGRLEELALAAHARLVSGERTLDLATDSPAVVRAWLRERGLAAALAETRPVRDAGSYRLAGATDLSRPGLAAAAVLYQVDGAPLVLVAARQDEVPEAPRWSALGKRVRYREAGAVRVLTWTNSGEAYALAAGPRVQRGCLLCHTDARRTRLVNELALPAPGGS